MGKLVLPGSPEFQETAKVLEFKPRRSQSIFDAQIVKPTDPVPSSDPAYRAETKTEDLRGKTLMLNLAVVRGFQCGGFQLSLHRPFAVVDDKAQLEPIRAALADGRLVDVTGQDPNKEFKTRDGSVSKVDQEDTGMQAFIGRTPKGELFVAIPKNKKQANAFAREIKRTGTLSTADLEPTMTGLSGITTEDAPLDAQGRLLSPDQPTRGKIRGRSSRPQRQSRKR